MVSVSRLLSGLLLVDQSVYDDVATPQQASVDQYNVVKYLGGSGPYKQHPGFGISVDIPPSCKLEQVQLLSRHGERFPTVGKGTTFKAIHEKLTSIQWKGSLSWLNELKYFVEDDTNLSLETSANNSYGPFSGISDMKLHGAKFKKRYSQLYNNESSLPIFTSNSKRVYQSALAFARGFFEDSEFHSIKINILDEDKASGCNSLTPWKSCVDYNETSADKTLGYDTSYLQSIAQRLSQVNFTTEDAYNLFEYCAYEINVTGNLKVCNLIRLDEYVNFGYHKDLYKYYSTGPGNSWSTVAGSVLLNSSILLLNEHDNANKIWISFTHDTDIDHYLSALGIFTPEADLRIDKIDFNRDYVHAYIAPQGARIYTEKLSCGNEYYVRYIVNDAVIPMSGCNSGPGFSCNLKDLNTRVGEKLSKVNFLEECGIQECKLSFYWDYPTTDYDADLKI